jgi:hypothetical protein
MLLAVGGWNLSPARGQEGVHKPAAAQQDSQDEARRAILDSDRWRRTTRQFDEWLSVQQLYRPDQVETIKAEMKQRIAHMSPRELEDFLDDMEARLHVLLSPEAAGARSWLNQFLAVARNPEQQLGRELPDVLNMNASQIRQELQWLQEHRDSRQQAQEAFNRTRAIQAQAAQNAQAARNAARGPVANRNRWPANTPPRRDPLPRREQPTMPPNPVFMIGPWGAPYFQFGGR